VVIDKDWEAFCKRNRVDPTVEVIYVAKIKNEADRAKLTPSAKRNYTGWVFVDKVPADVARKIIEKSSPDDRLTGWDMVSFEEMGETCRKCGLSWDDGRGCIGTFGPENSLLPGIASKLGLPIIANAVESSKTKKVFSNDDAKELLKEVAILREKLPNEGKAIVHRYGGVLDRLEKMANIAIKYRTRFYFV
jgi:DNA-directed RNA polymerase beta' subunit